MSRISRLVATAVVAGAVAVASQALGPGTALADPFAAQPHSWCPGKHCLSTTFNGTWVSAPRGTPSHSAKATCGWSPDHHPADLRRDRR
jgi:hypothetical protein